MNLIQFSFDFCVFNIKEVVNRLFLCVSFWVTPMHAHQCFSHTPFCKTSGDIVVTTIQSVRQGPGQARLSQLHVWVWSSEEGEARDNNTVRCAQYTTLLHYITLISQARHGIWRVSGPAETAETVQITISCKHGETPSSNITSQGKQTAQQVEDIIRRAVIATV